MFGEGRCLTTCRLKDLKQAIAAILRSLICFSVYFQTSLPVLENPLSARLNDIIRQIQDQRQHYLKVQTVSSSCLVVRVSPG